MTVYDLPHIASIRAVGSMGAYRVQTEEGYWIHLPSFEENVWKTITLIYPTDDLSAIQIVHESELPEGAELCGGNTEPTPEVM